MVAFCQVSSTAGSQEAAVRPGQGLVGGSPRRPWSLGSELVSRTRPADRRGEERGGRNTGAESRARSLRRPRNPAPRPAAAAAPADCGWAGGRAERPGRRRRGGAGPGRGGAVTRATAPTAQRGRGGARLPGDPAGRRRARWGPGSRRRRRPSPAPSAAAVAARRRGQPRRGGSEGAGKRRAVPGRDRGGAARGAAADCGPGGRPRAAPPPGAAPLPSSGFPCASAKHPLQAAFPDSRRPAGAGEPRAGEVKTAARPRPPHPFPGRGFP